MKRIFSTIGLLFLVVVGAFLYWRLGYKVGLAVLLLFVSLAVVGKGNRLIWLAVFPLICAAWVALIDVFYALLPAEPEIAKLLLAFTLFSVVPGSILWAAVKLARLRNKVAGRPWLSRP